MNKPALSLLLVLLLFQYHPALAADESGTEQLHQIEVLQRRAESLPFGQPGLHDYHLAKAKAWLDLALSQYHENDTTGSLSASIEQAEVLLNWLEKGRSDPGMKTPVPIPGSEAIRPDLWSAIESLKRDENFFCGQRSIANAEISMIRAGHEFHVSGQSQAEPSLHRAANLIHDAQLAIDDCSAASARTLERITLASDALFAFNRAEPFPRALWRIDGLADIILALARLDEVILVGHTDRLRSDGRLERNKLLSEQRAESIKKRLVDRGVPAEKISVSGAGSSEPLVKCSSRLSRARQIDCLQPNRRVEITLRGARSTSSQLKPQPAILTDQKTPEGEVDTQNLTALPAPVIVDGQIMYKPVQEEMSLSGDMIFEFGKSSLNPSALKHLDHLVDKISSSTHLNEVILVGHTDRMRSDGREELNRTLSEQRAEAIRQYLIGKGIPEEKIHASGAGSSQPIVECLRTMSRHKQIACLQPNRRVDIILRGTK